MGNKYDRYVQVEVGFPNSKLIDAARTDLGLDTDQAIGKLVRLWLAVIQTTDRGSLAGRSDLWIEEAVAWRGEPGRFAAFVRSKHLDENGVIRDWLSKYGKLDATREKYRTVKQGQRSRTKLLTAGSPVDTGVDSPVDNDEDDGEDNAGTASSSSSVSVAVIKQQPVPTQKPVGREGDPLLAVLTESNFPMERFEFADGSLIGGFLRGQRSPLAVALTLRSHLVDEEVPPAALALAVREYMGKRGSDNGFEARYFAGFVKSAVRHLTQKPMRAAARQEERFIASEDIEAERFRREEAEVTELLADFERLHGEEFLTLQVQANKLVDPKVRGMMRQPMIRAALVKLIRERGTNGTH